MSSQVRIIGEPAVEKALDRFDDRQRQNLERRAVRAGGKVVAKAMAELAASSPVPHSFAKIRVRVSASMRTGGIPHAVVRPASPLFNIFEGGAGSHEIAPKTSGTYLRGRGKNRRASQETHSGVLAGPAGGSTWDPTGRKRPGAFFARGPVSHPGMHARPLLARAAGMSAGEAQSAMAAIILGQAGGSALGSGE